MPTYEYRCGDCDHQFEVFQSIKDQAITECPKCHNQSVHRLIGSGTGLIFKGSGYYLTDYRRKNGSTSKSPDSTSKPEKKKTESVNTKKQD